MGKILTSNVRYKFALILAILGLVGLVSGTSYAILRGNTTSQSEQIIKVGSVMLQLTENYENISEEITMLSDEEGLIQDTTYSFNIKNIGGVAAKYDVKLVNEAPSSYTGNVLDDEYIKVGLEINGVEHGPFSLSEVENVIDSDIINQKEIINYDLRLWINDEKADQLNTIQNYKSFLKLEVVAEQSTYSSGLDTSGANPPVLSDNMIAVYYDETCNDNEGCWEKANSSNRDEKYKWYDYDSKMWANSVTVTSTNRNKYLKAAPGTEIPMDDILTMQVWVPRYKYTVWNYNSDGTATSEPQEIDIVFESGRATTGEIKCTDLENMGTSDGTKNGTQKTTSETCKIKATNTECTNNTCNEKTYTHPAFTFGDKELEGFWVGKFEVSSDTTCTPVDYSAADEGCNLSTIRPLVKPNVVSWRGAMISVLENSMMSMNGSQNKYGFTNTEDTHMMKNMEWGAVAYLSHSKYGTCSDGECSEIALNSNSSYKTGCGPQASGSTSSGSTCNAYNTTLGQSASTTGNIYGIYDMSGGANEHVMANLVSPDGLAMMTGYITNESFPNYHSGYSGILYYDVTNSVDYESYTGIFEYPDSKYYDKYSYSTSSTTRGRSKLGDSIKEVYYNSYEGWYNDSSYIANTDRPWIYRGGYRLGGIESGLFNSFYDFGYAYSSYSARLVISQ